MENGGATMRQRTSMGGRAELHRLSAQLTDPASEDAIIEYIKCPFCRQYIQPPCVSCEKGHFMCTPCRAQVEACPTCRSTNFPNKVNIVFDKILREIYYPCVNEENGCVAFFKYAEINQHQKHCTYVKVACRFKSEGCKTKAIKQDIISHEDQCPYGVPCRLHLSANGRVMKSCQWRGSKDELYDHVCSHPPQSTWLPPNSLRTNVTFTWMLAINMDFYKTEFIRLEDVGEMFYFHVKTVPEGPQYIAVQHIGSEQVGATFMYAVEFKYGTKQIVFRDVVISSQVDDVFADQHCCTFHSKFLLDHFQAERVCDCYVRIFRIGQENDKGKRILNFLGTVVSEERDGCVSNRESFKDKIEYCLESFDKSQEEEESSA